MAGEALGNAREFAATFLDGMRRSDLAAMIRAGAGDDFPEVQLAEALLQGHVDRVDRLEQALRLYADADFWDEETSGGSLASHDRGTMAINALAGRPAFYHRD